MRIIFVGTSSFGIPILKKLISLGEDIVAVITQPDRPSGRGKKIQASPIKDVTLNNGLHLLQPENINDDRTIQNIKALNPDMIILVAYGQILSKEVLNIPTIGCLNIHPSLLPKYKGPAPIQWAIIRGETETGISFLFMNEKVDAGDIIAQKKIEILLEENFQELSKKLATASAEMLKDILDNIKTENYEKILQPKEKYFYARKLNKTDYRIHWENRAINIYNLIRGVSDIPGAYTEFKGKKIKITRALLLEKNRVDWELSYRKPGYIEKATKEGLFVLSGDKNLIIIKRLILSGSKEMEVSQFINGYHTKKGDFLS